MITLTFQRNSLDEYKTDEILTLEDAAILEATGFALPIMFLVNNVNLFEITQEKVVLVQNVETRSLESTVRIVTSTWLSMPILNFALHGLEAARQVYQRKPIDLILPEIGSRLCFQISDKEVEIYSSLNGKTAIADSLELLQAFENFRNEVRNFLGNELPQLKEYSFWDSWFE